MSGLERVEPEGVDVVPARRTVVTALPLKDAARERLASLLGARVLDVRAECADPDLVIVPSSSPQLVGRLKALYPGARVVVAELEDADLDIELTGPVTRLLRGGADGYVVADSLADLARKLGAPVAADDEPAAAGREHTMPHELHATRSLDELVTLLRQADAERPTVDRGAIDR